MVTLHNIYIRRSGSLIAGPNLRSVACSIRVKVKQVHKEINWSKNQ